jgi:hypothetical protein
MHTISLKLSLIICLIVGGQSMLLAQATTTISGVVIDVATGSPMPFANVYLNNTTHGTTSNEKGYFLLTNVPVGIVDVVASFVGYHTGRQTIRVDQTKASTITFQLKPGNKTLDDVTVKASRNEKKWQQQLRWFKQQLFGEPYGNQCVLTNPDVLRFTEENGHLKAKASEPLAIENQALGYRLWFDLSYFDAESNQVLFGGAARFEEIKGTSERQENRFRRNRMRAYLGSARHLMASLIADNYEQEGFRVYQKNLDTPLNATGDTVTLQQAIGRRLLPVKLTELIQPGQLSVERRLVATKPLVVFYTKKKSLFSPYVDARYAYSQIKLPNGPVQLLTDGWITVPNGIEMQGSLANDRLSTLLPADWKPGQSDDTVSPGEVPINAPSLARINTLYSSEKAYLHTDRSQYVAGDTLWFNAYLVDATYHTAVALSKTVYVNLLDSTGQLTASRILRIDSTGHAPGDMTLADSLPAGTYQLLAYTNRMRNADPAFLFRKAIHIDSKNAQLSERTANVLAGFSLQVFPEGGQLVAGLPGRVAFQALDRQGRSLPITGVLLNESGDTLTDFRSLHKGMGTFLFTPRAGQHYRAMAASADGQLMSVQLPDALPAGYQLAVDNLTNPGTVRVFIRNSQPATGQLTLFAHVRGQVCYQVQVDANKTEMILAIPGDSIRQDGILHLTLFDPDNQPVAERLVFVDQHRQLGIRIQPDKISYQPRQPVYLTISTTDPSGKPVATRLSLAITDRKQAPDVEPGAATLRSYLLLTSDLRGHIEDPEFYFDSTQAHVRQYLDYVMLTHGWRRFDWRAILSDSLVRPVYRVETGLPIGGQVRYDDDKKLAREATLTGMLKTNQSLVQMDIITDKEGRFSMENLLFSDIATVIIRHRTNRPVKLRLSQQTVPDYIGLPALSISSQTDRQAQINKALEMQLWGKRLQQNGGTLLQAATVKGRRLDASRKDYRRQLYGKADATLVVTEQLASGKSSVWDLLAYVPTLRIGKGSPILVDGVLSSSIAIDGMNPNDIEAIDALINPATLSILGVQGGGNGQSGVLGAINFLTKRSPGEGRKMNQAIGNITGYAVSRTFYSPQYTDEAATPTPDYRATLYWNPAIQTDATGKATVTFYNSDEITTVQVIAEGISPSGAPGYGKVFYKVSR